MKMDMTWTPGRYKRDSRDSPTDIWNMEVSIDGGAPV